jgi:hypothetical protein
MGTWIPVFVALVSAAGAATAAVIAGRSASRTKAAELAAAQLLDLERRQSESRAEVFEPLIEALFRLWEIVKDDAAEDVDRFEKEVGAHLRRFLHWVSIYGSDDAVRMALRFMQSSYHAPPPQIQIRMIGDLIVTARRELGYADTDIGPVEVLGMRINDIYDDEAMLRALTDPFEAVAAELGWVPPWTRAASVASKRHASESA